VGEAAGTGADAARGSVPDAVHDLAEVTGRAVDAVREGAAPVIDAVREGAAPVIDAVAPVVEATAQAAEVAETHVAVSGGARLGFFLDGLLHVAIGWAGLQLAWLGRSSSTADESGALTGIASTFGGRLSLWAGFLGFSVVALWNLARALTGRHCPTRLKRLEHAADGIAYVTVAWSAVAFAVGAGQSSRASTIGITRTLLALPAGELLVVLAGGAVAAVGGFSIWSGVTRDFLVDLARRPGRALVVMGVIGFVARGVAFGLVGLLFVLAAATHRSAESTGVDGALHWLQRQPAGQYALAVISLGLVFFGVYLMLRARHLRA
jgi:hypothetical protein